MLNVVQLLQLWVNHPDALRAIHELASRGLDLDALGPRLGSHAQPTVGATRGGGGFTGGAKTFSASSRPNACGPSSGVGSGVGSGVIPDAGDARGLTVLKTFETNLEPLMRFCIDHEVR